MSKRICSACWDRGYRGEAPCSCHSAKEGGETMTGRAEADRVRAETKAEAGKEGKA